MPSNPPADFHSLKRRNMRFAHPTFHRLLKRLRITYQNEPDTEGKYHHNLYVTSPTITWLSDNPPDNLPHNIHKQAHAHITDNPPTLLKYEPKPKLIYSLPDNPAHFKDQKTGHILPTTSKLVDFVVSEYVPHLIATNQIPPPIPPTRQQIERQQLRDWKNEQRAKGLSAKTGHQKMSPAEVRAMGQKRRWGLPT